MKNFLKKAIGGASLAFMVLALAQPALATIPQAKATGGSAALNADPQDFAVLAVSNYTRCPGSNGCWGPSISGVQSGDVISFVFYAHNTGSQPATNTHVAMTLNSSGSHLVGHGVLSADNAPAVYDDVNVTFAGTVPTPVTLTYVGSDYYANSSVDPTHPDAFPNGTTGRQIAQGGINIGTLQNDYAGQFTKDVQIVVRYRVDGGTQVCDRVAPTLTITPSSNTTNVGGTANYHAIYDSNGSCAGGESDVTGSAAWSSNNTNIGSSLGSGDFRGVNAGNTGIRATYSGLQATANLTVTDDNQCSRAARLDITPTQNTISTGDTANYRAIYDSNGDCAGGQSDVTGSASWTIDNSSIGTNLGSGNFRGQSSGTTNVRASYNGLSNTASLRVNGNGNGGCNGNETLVIVPYTATFGVNQTYQYRALYDADGPGCNGAERDVTDSATWTNNSGNVANLNGGRFRGIYGGNSTITARYSGITATGIANVIGDNTLPPVQQPPVYLPPTVIPGGTITLPPTVVGGGTIVRQPTVGTVATGVADESVACITVTPSVDVTSMLPGQDFIYTTLYRNDCPFALNSAVLRVFIPNDVEFKASSNPFFIREGQKLSYNLGILPPGGQGSVAISGFVRKDARLGDTETFTSSIEFTDSNARIQGTTSYLVAVLGGDIRRTLAANISDTLGHIFGSAWLWIIIFLLILAGIVWFIIAMIMRRNRTVVHAPNKVVVAPAEDPLRALRNA